MRLFVYLQFSINPFFDAIGDHHLITSAYQWIYLFGVTLGFLYIMYFGILTYSALQTIRTFQRSYRIITSATILVMLISSIIMIFNGQVSQRMDVRLFMSLYVLFNLYVYFLAYLYTPSLDYLADIGKNNKNLSEAEKERNKIMNEFYSVEM